MPSQPDLSPVGIAGNGAVAEWIAAAITSAALPRRVLVHGISLAGQSSAKPRDRHARRIERTANLFDLASECEIVVTAYETHAALIEAFRGSHDRPGLIGALTPGSLIADFTPAEPHDARRLAGLLSPHAIGLVECAIGRPPQETDTPGIVFAGGFGEHIDRFTPLLIHICPVVERSGAQGTANLAAAYCNLTRLLSHLVDEDWGTLSTAAGLASSHSKRSPLAPSPEIAELSKHLAVLRQAAAADDIAVPFLDMLAEALDRRSRFRPP